MPTTTNPMAALYRRLREFGLTNKFVKSIVLPSWWTDEIAENPTGYAQAMMLISQHLGIDLRSLANQSSPIEPIVASNCKFKKNINTEEAELGLARAMATRAAMLISAATTKYLLSLPEDGLQVRREILGMNQPWVHLGNLLDYCWAIGVPVVHLTSLPQQIKRPDGLVTVVKGRPVIILCRRVKSPSRQLFTLAHELGHVVLGHVRDNGILVDEKVDRSSVSDKEEIDADKFALSVLTGNADCRIVSIGRLPSADNLAMEARRLGHDLKIDPGHVVMNFAYTSKQYALAVAALQYLEPHSDGPQMIRRTLFAKLDWSVLPEDSSEFLMRVVKPTR